MVSVQYIINCDGLWMLMGLYGNPVLSKIAKNLLIFQTTFKTSGLWYKI